MDEVTKGWVYGGYAAVCKFLEVGCSNITEVCMNHASFWQFSTNGKAEMV